MDQKPSLPSWKLGESLAILVFIFLINNFLAFILKALGFFKLPPLAYFSFANLLQTFSILFFVWLVVFVKYGEDWSALGLGLAGWGKAFKQGLWAGLGIFFIVAWAGAFLERLFPISAELQPFARMVLEAKTGPELFLLFLLGAVLAPVGEEVYFRGFLYPSLKSHLGVWGGIVFSGMVFGMLHFDFLRFFPLALGGIGLAFLYERTGSLYSCIAAHGLWNFVMLLLLLLSRQSLA